MFPAHVGVCTVATNRYVDYWCDMARSADKYLFPGRSVTLHVFTDEPERADQASKDLRRLKVQIIEIPPLGWPAATLDRYRLISEARGVIGGDLLIHMDADMLFVGTVGPELTPRTWPNGLAFVRHPGYFRPSASGRLSLYGRSTRTLVWDARNLAQMGALGLWESRASSRAFVPRGHRRLYYCGGVWFGQRDPVLDMCAELSSATQDDTARGITAVWHDESHLNRYASEHRHAVLGPEYCHVSHYPQLSGIRPLICALEKGEDRTR